MKIQRAHLYQVDLPLRKPFETSAVYMTAKNTIILALTDSAGHTGYGECAALEWPYYSEEFRAGAWELLKDQLLPLVLGHEIDHPDDSEKLFCHFRKNKMAKSAVNSALWDLYAKERGVPLAQLSAETKNGLKPASVSVSKSHQPNWFRLFKGT